MFSTDLWKKESELAVPTMYMYKYEVPTYA